MSYKDYSEEAVKEILSKVSQSRLKGQNADFRELSQEDPEKTDQKCGFDSVKIQTKEYEYNHPAAAEIKRMTDTHIIIEKWFESELSEEIIWKEIITELKVFFAVERKSGEVKKTFSGRKWSYISHSNHETVVRLKTTGRVTSLKIIQRLGFWRSQIEGVLHGLYTSLILFGILYGLFKPQLLPGIGIFALLWTVVAFTIYRFSVLLRKKKLKHLSSFTNKLTNQFTLHS